MFHVVFLVKRSPTMDLAAFTRYWIQDHTPFTARVPGVRAYRCYAATGAEDGGDPALDGVAVLSFDDEAAYRAAMAGPEFAAALADAPNFQDVAATTAIFADEFVIV